MAHDTALDTALDTSLDTAPGSTRHSAHGTARATARDTLPSARPAVRPGTAPRGIHVPLVTPFSASGEVAADALEALAHEVLDAGAAGIVALGTTAEAAALDAAERERVTDVCARVCAERGALLTVGAGSADTRASEAALRALERRPEAGAALVAVPSFVRPSAAGVLAHFERLAAASPVPLIVYHIPYRTGLPLDAPALRALAELPGVTGMKYAGGGIDQEAMALLGDLPDGFALLAGDDVYASPLLALGAAGGILASAHLATARFVELAAAWGAGDVRRARALGHALAKVSAAVFAEPNPVVVKGVLHAQGRIPTPDVRLPLLPAGRASVETALARLEELSDSHPLG
ncbi:dihydrodipicolinate synthase family protein [Streptomyces bambusae]|uniref:4-hydroxy-tetrahydrodipicolinate synthase n=1 Tax=Streptomyces bambusae TaxID=1550616 RepID=A0ABS6ZCB0_9ACTN|nr:dihydrodipicolinate synthase family protein [Streptomyces bambusae]MBW5485382.1 4-hydroxy-tetrahydrodipicolinate synthase [Streptomyces bambusae]